MFPLTSGLVDLGVVSTADKTALRASLRTLAEANGKIKFSAFASAVKQQPTEGGRI